jgi:hypothetical protein
VNIPRSVTLAAVLTAAVAMIAGCGSAAAPSGSPSSPAPTASTVPPSSTAPSAGPSAALASLILKVSSEGGFINPAATIATLPSVAVYADGRIITPGAIDAMAPGPLVVPVVVRNVGAAGAASILAAVRHAGLDKPATGGGPGVPGDSGTTVFTVIVDGTTTTTRLTGNGPGVGGPGGPTVGSADPHRTAAFDLLNRLVDPNETWGAPAAPPTSFVPVGYRVYVAPAASGTDQAGKPVQWPLSTPLGEFGTPAVPDRGIAGLRQGVILGADAASVRPILEAARTSTPFTSGGKSYTLYVRPLLPDEAGG